MLSNFDRLRIGAGAALAIVGLGVLGYSFLIGFMDSLSLAGFGALFVLVGIVIAMSSKDGHLAEEILAFFRVL